MTKKPKKIIINDLRTALYELEVLTNLKWRKLNRSQLVSALIFLKQAIDSFRSINKYKGIDNNKIAIPELASWQLKELKSGRSVPIVYIPKGKRIIVYKDGKHYKFVNKKNNE